MGVLRVDHPDIEEYIYAKQTPGAFECFNLSIATTDEFMEAVAADKAFDLRWNGKAYKTIRAKYLFEQIMRSTWDYAEPGVLFIDTINKMNNLYYCEEIAATNPCGEQPLPPFGACLLGSFNLAKYIYPKAGRYHFDWDQFVKDIPPIVRMMDNIVDVAIYPLEAQKLEAKSKRRMGLGYAGLANAGEALGFPYASPDFLKFQEQIGRTLFNTAYASSVMIAAEKGSFPLYDAEKYCNGYTIAKLDKSIIDSIKKYGIRNSHLTSIAPTGTISLAADNISSGVEPVYSIEADRKIMTFDGEQVRRVNDYGYEHFNVKPKTAAECTADDHVRALIAASKWVDSAVSKTCNINPKMPWDDFKELYFKAWKAGCKGCTTFNPGGKRMGILQAIENEEQGATCSIDPNTGQRSCE
jgi:ribonucleoside-diphosphate reductase alpha chain